MLELNSDAGLEEERKKHFSPRPLKHASNSCYSWTKENSSGASSIQLTALALCRVQSTTMDTLATQRASVETIMTAADTSVALTTCQPLLNALFPYTTSSHPHNDLMT